MTTIEPDAKPERDPAEEDRLDRGVTEAYRAAGVPDYAMATPAQAAKAFEHMSPEVRVWWVARQQDNAERAHRCFAERHQGRIEELQRRLACPHAYIPAGVHHEIQAAEHAARQAREDGNLGEEHVNAVRAAHAKVQQCEVPLDQHWAYQHRHGEHAWSTAPEGTPAELRNAASKVREEFAGLIRVRLHGSEGEQIKAWDATYLAFEALTEALLHGDLADGDTEAGGD